MTNLQAYPEASKSPAILASQATGIIIALRMQLKNKPNLMAFGILNSIREKMPALDMIREIRQMIADNEPSMKKLLGDDLLQRIKKFQP